MVESATLLAVEATGSVARDVAANRKKRPCRVYVNDYLMNLKRVSYNGRIGFMGDDRQDAFKDISVWQSK